MSGQRTGDDFIPRTVVEVLQNNGGISFDVVTPTHWSAELSDWETDTTAILRAAWGDLDADGLLDVAVQQLGRKPAGDPGRCCRPFEQELLAGMTGTRLQFGNFDTEQENMAATTVIWTTRPSAWPAAWTSPLTAVGKGSTTPK